MLYTKLRGNQPAGSREEDFTIYGRGDYMVVATILVM